MARNLEQFAQDLQQEIISLSGVEDLEAFQEDQFTAQMISYLSEAGELDDGIVCHHQAHGIKVNGYSLSDDNDCLDLLISIYTGSPLPERIGKAQVETAFRQLIKFFEKALKGYHYKLEESCPAFDLALHIYELSQSKDFLSRARLFLVTDGIVKIDRLDDAEIDGIPVSHHVWDIERLYRWWSSGSAREKIEINFVERPGGPIPCLKMPQPNSSYTTYLAIVSGSTLLDLYSDYGPRLLERNVRSFLQARGKINSGIRKTILEVPDMFLAYNNGITATAEAIELTEIPEGGIAIKSVSNLQIVNGGQTTASIYHAARKDKADVTQINVQMKLSVILDAAKMDEFVPRISEYANSQNKVNAADFSANDPFHRKVEELSRTVWAPAAHGSQRQTHWFYERARGQYMDAVNRELTPARRKAFETTNPRSQMFTKTDLAKFENTWDQFPYLVSRGAQKNFQEFTLRLKEHRLDPDVNYFEHLVAKAILYRQTEKVAREQKYEGYRANIVTYTLSLLFHLTAQRIDLDKIWREQDISPALRTTITSISRKVHKFILKPPGHANVTEWCKKKDCWEQLCDIDVELPQSVFQELITAERVQQNGASKGITSLNKKDLQTIDEVMQIPSETWFKISAWAKETNNLQSWQRGLSYSLGRLAKMGKEPTIKQATQAVKILKEAQRLGFGLDGR